MALSNATIVSMQGLFVGKLSFLPAPDGSAVGGMVKKIYKKIPCRYLTGRGFCFNHAYAGLFVSFVVNDTFCDLLDVQEVLVVDVVAQVVAAIGSAAEGE